MIIKLAILFNKVQLHLIALETVQDQDRLKIRPQLVIDKCRQYFNRPECLAKLMILLL
jgi:hypothetical protein